MRAKNKSASIRVYLLIVSLGVVCCGCATLGAAGAGMGSLVSSLVMLPFKVVEKALGIASKMPAPPPGVF